MSLARLASEAYIASQEFGVRACIRSVEKRSGLSLDEIRRSKSELAIAALRSLMCSLSNLGLPLYRIEEITKTHYTEVQRVLEQRRKDEVRIRTMKWGEG